MESAIDRYGTSGTSKTTTTKSTSVLDNIKNGVNALYTTVTAPVAGAVGQLLNKPTTTTSTTTKTNSVPQTHQIISDLQNRGYVTDGKTQYNNVKTSNNDTGAGAGAGAGSGYTSTSSYSGGGGGGGGGSKNDTYLSSLADIYKKQFEAEQQARDAEREATRKANKENAERAIGVIYNQARANSKSLNDLINTGVNGNLLSQQLANKLERGRQVHDVIKERNNADANGEVRYWDQYANSLGNFANGLVNAAGSASSLGKAAFSDFRKRISEIYDEIF